MASCAAPTTESPARSTTIPAPTTSEGANTCSRLDRSATRLTSTTATSVGMPAPTAWVNSAGSPRCASRRCTRSTSAVVAALRAMTHTDPPISAATAAPSSASDRVTTQRRYGCGALATASSRSRARRTGTPPATTSRTSRWMFSSRVKSAERTLTVLSTVNGSVPPPPCQDTATEV